MYTCHHVSVLPTKATTHSLHFANDLAAVPCRAMPCHAVPCRAMPCHTVPTYQRQHGSCQALLTTQYSIETKLHYRCFLAREYKV